MKHGTLTFENIVELGTFLDNLYLLIKDHQRSYIKELRSHKIECEPLSTFGVSLNHSTVPSYLDIEKCSKDAYNALCSDLSKYGITIKGT